MPERFTPIHRRMVLPITPPPSPPPLLQVSGIRFSFDASLPPGHRVVPGSLWVGDGPMLPERKYKVLTKEYLSTGHDGFDVFKVRPELRKVTWEGEWVCVRSQGESRMTIRVVW